MAGVRIFSFGEVKVPVQQYKANRILSIDRISIRNQNSESRTPVVIEKALKKHVVLELQVLLDHKIKFALQNAIVMCSFQYCGGQVIKAGKMEVLQFVVQEILNS